MSWIRFLGRTARVDEAKQSLLELEQKVQMSDSGQALMLAECYATLQMESDVTRVATAIETSQLKTVTELTRYYALLAGSATADDKLAFLQDRIAEPRASQLPEIARWARRQLAVEWMGTATLALLPKAQELLQANLAIDSKSVEDRRAMAILLAIWHGTDEPKQALQIYEGLLQDNWTPGPEDSFMLGQLYVAAGDWGRGSRYFLQVLGNKERRQTRYLKKYSELLLRRKDPKEAELWVDLLRREGTQDVETAELLAEVRYQRGQFDLLTRSLVGTNSGETEAAWFASTVPARKRFEMLTSMITRLEGEDRKELAEKFQPAAEEMGKTLEQSKEFPGAFFATQLLARGETSKAVLALERVVTSSTEEELVGFAEQVLANGKIAAEDVAKLEGIFAGLGNKDETKEVYTVIEARLKEMRGDFTGAQTLYRKLILANGKNTVAMNNLSNLLALQRENLDEAMSLIGRVIDMEGETPFLLDTRGMVRLAKNETKEALIDFEKAVSGFPHPLLRFHLAWAYSVSGNLVESKKQIERASKDGLDTAQIHVLERPILTRLLTL
jgi:tetratricopeptide (TPR) repeat protein